ncbi:MAG TPA: hypothetical protein VK493_07145 [Bryobacteraceae bacterium]|nr:hypothetical protein [Bryobacteraceae bacterium]
MKLRFRGNSVRLRLNQREVAALAAGRVLSEGVLFPAGNSFVYTLEPSASPIAAASFRDGVICVKAPASTLREWAENDSIGLYFDLPGIGSSLNVTIEKDLECVNETAEERDPHAYPRSNDGPC